MLALLTTLFVRSLVSGSASTALRYEDEITRTAERYEAELARRDREVEELEKDRDFWRAKALGNGKP